MLYDPCAHPDVVDRLRKLVTSCIRKHVITPYQYLPIDQPLALLTWGCKYQMNTVNEQEVIQFIRVCLTALLLLSSSQSSHRNRNTRETLLSGMSSQTDSMTWLWSRRPRFRLETTSMTTTSVPASHELFRWRKALTNDYLSKR